ERRLRLFFSIELDERKPPDAFEPRVLLRGSIGFRRICQESVCQHQQNATCHRPPPFQDEARPVMSAACFGGRAGTPCNMPWALMSSSISGQCTPSPVPIISKLCRCSGVALERRHDQASGTLTVRPSASCAVMESSVTSIATIRGSL